MIGMNLNLADKTKNQKKHKHSNEVPSLPLSTLKSFLIAHGALGHKGRA